MKQFIRIKHIFIDVRDIRHVEQECTCWGKVWLWSKKEPIALGDGSYENNPDHISHLVCHFGKLFSALDKYAEDCTGPGWRNDV